MASSPNHNLPSPSISDVKMNFLYTIMKQNDEAMKEILAKMNSVEEENRKLRQELLEMKSYYQKHNVKASSRKRDELEDSSNMKAQVTNLSEPEHEFGHVIDPPASFGSLDDDCLLNFI